MCIFTLHVTKKLSFNILKTSLKIEKKTSIEEQSEGHALEQKTSESHLAKSIDENESKKLIGSRWLHAAYCAYYYV